MSNITVGSPRNLVKSTAHIILIEGSPPNPKPENRKHISWKKIILRDDHRNLQLAGTKNATMSGSQKVPNENLCFLEAHGDNSSRKSEKTCGASTQTLFMAKFNMDEDTSKRCIMNEEVDVVSHGDKVCVSWRALKSSSVDKRKTDLELPKP